MKMTRIVIALAIALTGITAAVATNDAPDGLPETFTFTAPQPGDQATFHFTRQYEGEEASQPLIAAKAAVGPWAPTWNSHGQVEQAQITRYAHAAYVDDDGLTSFHREDTTERLEWGLHVAGRMAANTAGNAVWTGSFNSQTQQTSDAYQGIVPAEQTVVNSFDSRAFPREGRLVKNCLMETLEGTLDLTGTVGSDAFCMLDLPWLDERITYTTGNVLGNRDGYLGGYLLKWDLTPLAAVETPFGSGIRFQVDDLPIFPVYAAGIPFPVQIEAAHSKEPFLDRIYLTEFTNIETAKPEAVTQLPAIAMRPAKPWGPDDVGTDLEFKPSEAWQAALDHPDGLLAGFLAAHPEAFTEAAKSGPQFSQSTTGDAMVIQWQFQLRDGDTRMAFTISPSSSDDDPLNLVTARTYEVEETTPEVFLNDLTEMPAKLPSLASLQRQMAAATGLSGLDWSWEPGCDAWVQAYCEPEEIGLRITGQDQTGDQEQSLDPEGPALVTEGRADLATMNWYPDGRIRSFVDSDYTRNHRLGAVVMAPPAEATEPAQEVTVEAGPITPRSLAIGGGAILAALAVYFWPTLKTAALGLFSRIQGAQSLDHPMRAQLAASIGADPGIHFQDLVRLSGAGRGATEHHLRKLVETGQVLRHDAGGYVCFFPKKTDRRIMAAAPALRSDTARQVWATIVAQPSTAPAIDRPQAVFAVAHRSQEGGGALGGRLLGQGVELAFGGEIGVDQPLGPTAARHGGNQRAP